jgi:sugar (pentulose or hexulose) kinase
LCGSIPGIEATNASAHGAFNLEASDWHHELIRSLGLDHLRWPALRKHGEVVGHLKLGSKSVPCYTPVGDAQAALAGALLTTEELSLNISTGSQASRLSDGLTLGDYQTRPYFDGKFINTFTHIPAGRSLDVLVGLLTELAAAQKISLEDSWAYIGEEAKKAADTDLEVDLSFFPGPGEDEGRISNIRGDNLNVGHLFRAAFNNMAQSYYECACRLWPDRSWRNLLFSGGLACKLEALREAIQKRFQTGYRLSPFAEDTLYGLLILASIFSGRAKSVEEVTRELRLRHVNSSM